MNLQSRVEFGFSGADLQSGTLAEAFEALARIDPDDDDRDLFVVVTKNSITLEPYDEFDEPAFSTPFSEGCRGVYVTQSGVVKKWDDVIPPPFVAWVVVRGVVIEDRAVQVLESTTTYSSRDEALAASARSPGSYVTSLALPGWDSYLAGC